MLVTHFGKKSRQTEHELARVLHANLMRGADLIDAVGSCSGVPSWFPANRPFDVSQPATGYLNSVITAKYWLCPI